MSPGFRAHIKQYSAAYIILVCILSRILFKLISGINNYELFHDSYRYNEISNRLIQGEWAMDINAYIIAPLYPLFLALIKLISKGHWELITVGVQFLMVGISALWIYRLALLVFKSDWSALISVILFIFYPLTLWYNFTLVQETMFQSLFIGFLYYLYKSYNQKSNRSLYMAGLLFGLSILTKSHALIALPFFLLWIAKYKSAGSTIGFICIVVSICLPITIINYQQYGTLGLSSAGTSTLFLLGHSDKTYNCILESAGTIEKRHAQGCDADFVFEKEYPEQPYSQINKMAPIQRFKSRKEIAIKWIKENPGKFGKLKWHGIKRFVIPGLDWNQYPIKIWLPSFLLGLLIYFPALLMLLKRSHNLNQAFKYIVWILLLNIFIIFILFFPVNRFRVITLEPMLIILAGAYYSIYIKKWLQRKIPAAIT